MSVELTHMAFGLGFLTIWAMVGRILVQRA